jgi:hypothetical protein
MVCIWVAKNHAESLTSLVSNIRMISRLSYRLEGSDLLVSVGIEILLCI